MAKLKAQNLRYKDRLAQKRRRLAAMWVAASVFIALLIASGIVYLVFLSPVFRISEVLINGLQTIPSQNIEMRLENFLSIKTFGFFELNRNILFSNPTMLVQSILPDYPQIKEAKAHKYYRHKVVLDFIERQPEGVWCLSRCRYFDRDNYFWGEAGESSGSILISILDKRQSEMARVDIRTHADSEYLTPIRIAFYGLKDMGMSPHSVLIENDSFRDFKVKLSDGLTVFFSLDTDILKQLSAMAQYLNQKDSKTFKPSYIDLRIQGRIYSK